jgi:hypothetical protein
MYIDRAFVDAVTGGGSRHDYNIGHTTSYPVLCE